MQLFRIIFLGTILFLLVFSAQNSFAQTASVCKLLDQRHAEIDKGPFFAGTTTSLPIPLFKSDFQSLDGLTEVMDYNTGDVYPASDIKLIGNQWHFMIRDSYPNTFEVGFICSGYNTSNTFEYVVVPEIKINNYSPKTNSGTSPFRAEVSVDLLNYSKMNLDYFEQDKTEIYLQFSTNTVENRLRDYLGNMEEIKAQNATISDVSVNSGYVQSADVGRYVYKFLITPDTDGSIALTLSPNQIGDQVKLLLKPDNPARIGKMCKAIDDELQISAQRGWGDRPVRGHLFASSGMGWAYMISDNFPEYLREEMNQIKILVDGTIHNVDIPFDGVSFKEQDDMKFTVPGKYSPGDKDVRFICGAIPNPASQPGGYQAVSSGTAAITSTFKLNFLRDRTFVETKVSELDAYNSYTIEIIYNSDEWYKYDNKYKDAEPQEYEKLLQSSSISAGILNKAFVFQGKSTGQEADGWNYGYKYYVTPDKGGPATLTVPGDLIAEGRKEALVISFEAPAPLVQSGTSAEVKIVPKNTPAPKKDVVVVPPLPAAATVTPSTNDPIEPLSPISLQSSSGLCLAAVASTADKSGGNVVILDCDDNSIYQKWTRRGKQLINGKDLCLDAFSATAYANGGNVAVWHCADGNSIFQDWTRKGNQLVNGKGLCLAASADSARNSGGNVVVWDCDDNEYQSWVEPIVPKKDVVVVPPRPAAPKGSSSTSTTIVWKWDTGETSFWGFNEGEYKGVVYLPELPGAGWNLVATGDLDGDGLDDILWRTDPDASGMSRLHFWKMVYGKRIKGVDVGPAVSKDWQVRGIGDLNGDGIEDIVFFNDDGRVVGWNVNKDATVQSVDIGDVSVNNWDLAAVGDVHNNGKADLVFRNKQTGQPHAWEIENNVVAKRFDIGSQTGTHWKIEGVGDITGDGTDDILFRDDNKKGTLHVWTMKDGKRASGHNVVAAVWPKWTILAVGDIAPY